MFEQSIFNSFFNYVQFGVKRLKFYFKSEEVK